MLAQGYDGHTWLRQNIQDLSRTSLPTTLAYTLLDHSSILAAGCVAFVALRILPFYGWLPVYILLALYCARQMRGLECLVHEASHYNWTRDHKKNDRLADVTAAWPVLSRVRGYRATHLMHHRLLGTEQDTDLIRWRKLRLDELRRDDTLQFTLGLIRRIVPYVPSWWWAIGVEYETLLRFALWHLVFIGISSLILGFKLGVLFWFLTWGFPLFGVLPILRFIGEIEEHNYPFESIVAGTNTNIGVLQRLLLHPHGDGYHTLHHLFPTIPYYRVAEVHRMLMAVDPEDYGAIVPVRRRIMDNVGRSGIPAAQ